MKLTIHFDSAVTPLTLELDEPEDQVWSRVKEALASDVVLEFQDVKGDKVMVSPQAVAFVSVAAETGPTVGFGRA